MGALYLEATGIKVPAGDNFFYISHGFMSMHGFLGKLGRIHDRNFIAHQVLDLELTKTKLLGGKLRADVKVGGSDAFFFHTYVDEMLRDYPLIAANTLGHEEVEVLIDEKINRTDLLVGALEESGAKMSLDGIAEQSLCHLGGLLALRRIGVAPDLDAARWAAYIQQAREKKYHGYGSDPRMGLTSNIKSSLKRYADGLGLGGAAWLAEVMEC